MKITKDIAFEAKKMDKLVFYNDEIKYARFKENFHGIARGSIIAKNRTIYSYPHIKRIFTLEKGIKRNLKNGSVYVEEKIDGYNLRFAKINGEIIAFSRGGFIDPFATEKLASKFKSFFLKFPSTTICCELMGNTPYTKPTKDFDIKFFVFDIFRSNGEYLACEERNKILRKFKIPIIPILGRFKKIDIKKIKRIALAALKSKKEGIVIKSANRKKALKFVNPFADIHDIKNNIKLFFDMPTGFYMQRILRSAFFIKEFDLNQEEYAKRLGNAYYENLIKTMRLLEKGGNVSEEYEITIKNSKTWNKLVKQMSREVKVEKIFERVEGNKRRIRFRKIYKKTSKRLRDLLNGKGMED